MQLWGEDEGKERKSLTHSQKTQLLMECDGRCQRCHKKFKDMGIKHPNYHHKDGKKWNANLSNFLVLCPNCHQKMHTYKKVRVDEGLWGTRTETKMVAIKMKKRGRKPKPKRRAIRDVWTGEITGYRKIKPKIKISPVFKIKKPRRKKPRKQKLYLFGMRVD